MYHTHLRGLILFACLVATGSVAGAPIPKERKNKDIAQQLLGKWKLVEYRPMGKKAEAGGDIVWEFQEKQFLYHLGHGDQRRATVYDYFLDTDDSPTKIDYGVKNTIKEQLNPGVITIEGDEMKLFYNYQGKGRSRPKDTTGENCYSITFQRVSD
jgi:uncharacterized protein (TIGR03067 family)